MEEWSKDATSSHIMLHCEINYFTITAAIQYESLKAVIIIGSS